MVYIAQQSFGFGEVDPNLRAQYESMQYQRGCRTLSNALLSDTGSARKRWGSVFHTSTPGDDQAFEFINGYGDRFLIMGSDTSYSIGKGSQLSSYTDGGMVTDVASTGNNFYVLTENGIFLHSAPLAADGDYKLSRVKVDINPDLIFSKPPVTFTANTAQPTTITASSNWFERGDEGDLYKITPRASSGNTSQIPRFGLITYVESSTSAKVTLGDAVNIDQTQDMYPSTDSTNVGKIRITNHPFVDAQELRWYRGFVGINYYFNEPDEGEVVYIKVIDADTVELYEEVGLITLFPITTTTDGGVSGSGNAGQSLSSHLMRQAVPSGHPGAITTATYDWAGPYRNWVNLPDSCFTTSSTTAGPWQGVIYKSSWAAKAAWKTEELEDTTFPFGAIAETCITEGSILKAEHWYNGYLLYKSYFMVSFKYFAGNDGPENDRDAYFTHIAGPAIQATANWPSPNSASAPPYEQMIWYVSSTAEPSSGSAAKSADGLPAPKRGWDPSLLVRSRDRSPDPGGGGAYIYNVGLVGSASAIFGPTSTHTGIPIINAAGQVTGSVEFPLTMRLTETVGEIGASLTSQTFRVGQFEVDGLINYYAEEDGENVITTPGLGASAYWKLTGAALIPTPSANPLYPSVWQTRPFESEFHQERFFFAGFEINTDINAGEGGLSQLREAQNLGLTIVASKSGVLTDFTISEPLTSEDGLSFQLSSRKGGVIRWMKSQFNKLFIGTDEEEFVITDTPIIPTSINISIQSEYGSRSNTHSVLFGSMLVYVQENGKTIRGLDFLDTRNRFESRDLLQFAKHITKDDTIKRVEVVGTATQRLFAVTDGGKLYCLTINEGNSVFGWSEWSNPEYPFIYDIVGTSDDSGNPALWVRTSTTNAIFITSDDARDNYHVDGAVTYTGAAVEEQAVAVSHDLVGKTLSVIVTIDGSGDVVYLGDFTVLSAGSVGVLPYGHDFGDDPPTQVVAGFPYTMTLAPNIPELMVPGKGSTLGREKNVSRLRVLFNQARGARAAGYDIFAVPLDPTYTPVADVPGFYSVPVVGQYGPQPTINITQSAPYGFEVSGYNAEYDFGD